MRRATRTKAEWQPLDGSTRNEPVEDDYRAHDDKAEVQGWWSKSAKMMKHKTKDEEDDEFEP